MTDIAAVGLKVQVNSLKAGRTLGHADAAMTAHYTHIEAEAHKAALAGDVRHPPPPR